MERRAKIVCTIGPSSASREAIHSLISGGMDVARLNFSHGDHEFHRRAAGLIRREARRLGRPVAILQDLQGIKIRVGPIEGGAMELKRGQELTVRPGTRTGSKGLIYVSYPKLADTAKPGDRILMDDGLMELRVISRDVDGSIRAKVIEGGMLRDRKGVNLPGADIKLNSFTKKDRDDLALGIELGVDYVAVSFVREAADIIKVRRWLKQRDKDIPVIAKIEKPEAVENINGILDAADGIMVARGDLGVELSPEDVPLLQKSLIGLANQRGKLVITATQMLESMTEHTRPTRAEAADVSNAVLDGTDALMLSAETSAGKHPVKALRMMDRIIRRTEDGELTSVLPGHPEHPDFPHVREGSFSEAVAESASMAAEDVHARYIVAFTQSGYTARLVSKFRPDVQILAFTPSEEIMRRMSLLWGVRPLRMRRLKSTEELYAEVDRVLTERRMLRRGEPVVIIASTPILDEGKTNFMKLHRVGGRP